MGEGIKIRTNILINLTINNDIKQTCQIKKITEGADTIKEELFGDMVEERWKLEKILQKKGITFEQFLLTLK